MITPTLINMTLAHRINRDYLVGSGPNSFTVDLISQYPEIAKGVYENILYYGIYSKYLQDAREKLKVLKNLINEADTPESKKLYLILALELEKDLKERFE